jgi:hypothetical protein
MSQGTVICCEESKVGDNVSREEWILGPHPLALQTSGQTIPYIVRDHMIPNV